MRIKGNNAFKEEETVWTKSTRMTEGKASASDLLDEKAKASYLQEVLLEREVRASDKGSSRKNWLRRQGKSICEFVIL